MAPQKPGETLSAMDCYVLLCSRVNWSCFRLSPCFWGLGFHGTMPRWFWILFCLRLSPLRVTVKWGSIRSARVFISFFMISQNCRVPQVNLFTEIRIDTSHWTWNQKKKKRHVANEFSILKSSLKRSPSSIQCNCSGFKLCWDLSRSEFEAMILNLDLVVFLQPDLRFPGWHQPSAFGCRAQVAIWLWHASSTTCGPSTCIFEFNQHLWRFRSNPQRVVSCRCSNGLVSWVEVKKCAFCPSHGRKEEVNYYSTSKLDRVV